MTKTYDYSEFDITNMNYHFANISPEVADEKQRLYEQFVAEKEAAKAQGKEPSDESRDVQAPKPAARPVFKPGLARPVPKKEETTTQPSEADQESLVEKPVAQAPTPTEPIALAPKPRPVFKPTMKRSEPSAPPPDGESQTPA